MRISRILALLAFTAAAAVAAEPNQQRPNVLFIAVDDLKPVLG